MWEFDVGKLVVPSVFMDVDLLANLEKRYDPLTRVVSNYIGDRIFSVKASIIREVFALTSNVTLLEKIDLSEFQSGYEA